MATEQVNQEFVDHRRFLDCVHCGLCLASCPTYVELGTEMDSPRGRIYLMRALQEGRLQLSQETVRHLDLCLGCRACETACPSGVHYGELIEGARPFIETHYRRPLLERWKRWAIKAIFPNPAWMQVFAFALKFGAALGLGRLAHWSRVPWRVRYWLGLLPDGEKAFFSAHLPERIPPIGEKRFTVGLLSGCVMPALFAQTNQATVKLLTHNGCEVIVAKDQVCCGALLLHNGNKEEALQLARKNVDTFSRLSLDALIINAAGCGAMMKEYGVLLKEDTTYGPRAEELNAKVKDIAEFLSTISPPKPQREVKAKVAYHDACHLAHGQGVYSQPRELLGMVPGLEIVDLPESDWCCGSAGTYNLTEPKMAQRLLERKVDNIASTGAEVVAMGNPGCLLQIQAGLKRRGLNIRAIHFVDLLAQAYG